MFSSGTAGASGKLKIKKIEAPTAPLSWRLKNWTRRSFIVGFVSYWAGWLFSRLTGLPAMVGQLEIRLIKADGTVVNYGIVGYRVVTTAFVNFVVVFLKDRFI